LVCKKCLKRADDGSAIKRALKSKLKARSRASNQKRPRVVMTDCFGICPKHAVTATSGALLTQGEYVLVRDHDQVPAAVDKLLGHSS
jgi:hypothetical protein